GVDDFQLKLPLPDHARRPARCVSPTKRIAVRLVLDTAGFVFAGTWNMWVAISRAISVSASVRVVSVLIPRASGCRSGESAMRWAASPGMKGPIPFDVLAHLTATGKLRGYRHELRVERRGHLELRPLSSARV